LAETFGLREPSDTPPATPSVKTAVLAIDDDSEFLQTIRDLLRTHGLDVYIAASGPKGLNILASAPENLRVLLLDYKMPQFDGMDTLRYVHQIRRNVKVIAVTAIPLNQLPEEFRRGVDKLIFKPFQTTDLLAAIEEFTSPLPSAPDALSGARVP
jgi:CheY-like chemotaxis protein